WCSLGRCGCSFVFFLRLFRCSAVHRPLHSFPTRRSSDLAGQIAIMHHDLVEKKGWISEKRFLHALNYCMLLPGPEAQQLAIYIGDRKSTRLNSSHVKISYAVFCLKKKKKSWATASS